MARFQSFLAYLTLPRMALLCLCKITYRAVNKSEVVQSLGNVWVIRAERRLAVFKYVFESGNAGEQDR